MTSGLDEHQQEQRRYTVHVESCVSFDVEDRPSAQEALALIEQCMPTYAEGMDRWGTLSWVKA
jgi:hypothetical protein